MVSPMLFASGSIAVLQLCKEIYLKYQSVKRFRDDCKKLAHFVHRVEGFLMETEDEADMTGPGWQAAFAALHESLIEVSQVFDDCARFGIVRSLINADEINLRLSSIAQRMTMALQLIPIQKAKVADKRLVELNELQCEIRTAQFSAARAAEEQSAQLKRLMDQSRLDASKTQQMLAQVLQLLQADAAMATSAAAAAAGPGPAGGPAAGAPPCPTAAATAAVAISPDRLDAEVQDLKAEMMLAQRDKNVLEEQYLAQIIAAIEAMEVNALEGQHNKGATAAAAAVAADADVPSDLVCPITRELLEDPVILVDSHQTYERSAIEEWLGRGNTKDPITGIQLKSTMLVPNVLVRKLATEWLEQHPNYRKTAAEASAAAATTAPQAAAAAAAAAAAVVDDVSAKKPLLSSSGSGSCGFSAVQAAAALSGIPTAALADHCKGSSSGSKGKTACQLQLEQQDNDDFKPHPKSEAVLAAVQSNMFDPSVLYSKQQQLQQESGIDEKAAAQRAYAAAVAAAAEVEDHPRQGVTVYSIFKGGTLNPAGSECMQLKPVGPAAALSAAGTYGASSSSAAADADFTTYAAGAAAAAAAATNATKATAAATAAAATTAADDDDSTADSELLRDQLGSLTLLEQQQHAHRYLQHAQSSMPSSRAVQGCTAPQLQHSYSSAAALARDSDSVTLEDFRATFGHMAQTRTHLAMKHGTQMEKIKEAQRVERAEHMRRNIERQSAGWAPAPVPSYEAQYRLQQLQEEEPMESSYHDPGYGLSQDPQYYHHRQQGQQQSSLQHQQSYQTRMSPHPHLQQQQQQQQQQLMFDYHGGHVHRESSAPAVLASYGSSSARYAAPIPSIGSQRAQSGPSAAGMHVQHAHSMHMPISRSGSAAAAAAGAGPWQDQAGTGYFVSGSSAGGASSGRSGVHASSSTTATSTAAANASGSSKWSFGRKKSSKPGDDAAFDDAASMSSDGSKASKRSVGQGVMSAMKSFAYSIKYDDEKC